MGECAVAVAWRGRRNLKLWTLYVDLEESLGTVESTQVRAEAPTRKICCSCCPAAGQKDVVRGAGHSLRLRCRRIWTCAQAAYDRVLELRIATPQLILNYAAYLQVRPSHAPALARPRAPLRSLSAAGAPMRTTSSLRCTLSPWCARGAQEHKFWEESFKVYEKGVAIFKYPHVKDIWAAYLKHFVERCAWGARGACLPLPQHCFAVAMSCTGPLVVGPSCCPCAAAWGCERASEC